jgi:outer membrane biosynthesis protein TonB
LYASSTSVFDSNATLENVFLRGYATATKKKPSPKKSTTRKTTTKKTTTKKTAAKKKKPAAKKAKPKKKAAKKVVKKKKAKKPVKPVRPKVRPLPSPRGLSSFVVYLQSQLKSSTGPDAAGRLKAAVASWKSLSDAEQEVHLCQYG